MATVLVEVELQATATGGTLMVMYDGKPAGQATLVGAMTSAPNGAYLEIGARSEQFHPHDFVCAFDSVVADVH